MINIPFLNNKSSITTRLLLFLVATTFHINAQELEKDEIDILLDDLFFNEQELVEDILNSFNTYNFLYSNISFNNNTFFSGRESGVNQFNIVPQLSYYSSSGFNVSVSGIYYETFNPNWDFTNISLGYYKAIGKEKLFHYNVGYTRYFYSNGWDTFTNSTDLSLGIRNKNKSLGTKFSVSYLFGKDQSFQIVSSSYANASLSRTKNYVLKFRPQISFLIAQQTIALAQLPLDTNLDLEYEYNDIFDLLNTQLNLPISLSTKSWDFELGYNINFPSPVESESNLDITSFFNLSIGYLIDLDKK
ncbi:MAG: hypothetical protein HKO92_11325 [Flavobacteriaceae bacterium]|nr:hypothetical protein [Flavobacteriaceae bacterium]